MPEDSFQRTCSRCNKYCDPYDETTWRETTSWVGGRKRDSSKHRSYTGRVMHGYCMNLRDEHVATDQATLDQPVEPAPVPDVPIESEDLPFEEHK